ncbi:hypothetical protein AAHA92_22588 [Salvia divinorum]|uniref:Uncharacterized protein n=1 Tax=Salvia divinorum TaxID=28513 RepID=A0ABD1GP60_SALDI
MHSVPPNHLLLSTRPTVSSFYGGSSFHRLKHLQKSDRRGIVDVTQGFLINFTWASELVDHRISVDQTTFRIEGLSESSSLQLFPL